MMRFMVSSSSVYRFDVGNPRRVRDETQMKCQWALASFPTPSMDGRMALTGQHRPSVNSLGRLSNRCCTGSALVVRLERVVPDLDSNPGYANSLQPSLRASSISASGLDCATPCRRSFD